MKNLKLSTVISKRLGFLFEGGKESLRLSAFDAEQNRIFFASSANVLYSLSLDPCHNDKQWSRDVFSPENGVVTEADDNITALEYLMEKEALIVGTSSGYLILHSVDLDITEIVGRVDGGIKTIASSPDGALFAVIAGLGQLLVMTHDWEVLYEVSLDHQLLGDGVVDETNGFSDYPLKSIISWRGDGKYFATLTSLTWLLEKSSKLKIWERDSGSLHAEAQPDILVGECLAWMPSGAKLAAIYDRMTEKKCPLVVLFEKNGLERSTFSLDVEPETKVKCIKWNCSSDLLAVSVACDDYDAIKIWYFCNNHWYLKQELRYPKADDVKFDWDPIKPFCLICWTADGSISIRNFIWVTAVMETSDAFVIDNSTILVSPLDVSLMPPPLFLFRLKFPSPVQDLAFACENSKTKLAVFLADRNFCVVELPPKDVWEQFEGETFSLQASNSNATIPGIRHLMWLDSHVLLGVCSSDSIQSPVTSSLPLSRKSNGGIHVETSLAECIVEIELVCSENCISRSVTSSCWHAKICNMYPVEGRVIEMVPNPAKRFSAFVQLDGGSLCEYTSRLDGYDGSVVLDHKSKSGSNFSASCPWMKAVLITDGGILNPLIFGLSSSGNLQIGQKTLCSNCSSFSFYSDSRGIMQNVATHLIFTTKQDLLFVVTLGDILHDNIETQIDCTSSRSRTRKDENGNFMSVWERGAKLAGIIHGDEASVILQAPRGSLECIYPRKLVIAAIANALVQQRFKDAILMVRRHRIDFNIIVDYCGLQSFVTSANEFVKQINNLGHITEFVCAINGENVASTLYKNALPLDCLKTDDAGVSVGHVGLDPGNKISLVLQAVRKAIEELVAESPARELCILTTLARSEPPELEEALKRVKFIRELEVLGTHDEWRASYPSAEEAMKHLLWLSNEEAVYNAALGLYDLNLAAIVALNADKDPKEFLPFLQELECMQPAIMRYTIDVKLHHHESALRNIASAGDGYFGDCMNLMRTNPELFPIGIQLFNERVKRNQILDAWGDHLQEEKHFEEAATTYLCCCSFEKALKAFRACGDWKGVLRVARLLNLQKAEVLQLASDLCEELQAIGKPAEAAKIALEYCADIAGGVAYYLMAREWHESLRIAYLHEREDLVKQIEDSALECTNALIGEYEEGLEKVGKYVARYLAVRQRRLSLAAKIQSEDGVMKDIDDDNVSEASSTLSGMSVYSNGSVKGSGASLSSHTGSKGRGSRRQRNRGKIRAGSPGEELALIEHLKGMSLTTSAELELKSLLLTLIMLGKEEPARKLQRIAGNFQLTQIAAVMVVEDAASSTKLDDNAYSLDHYVKNRRNESGSSTFTWQMKALISH